MENKEAKKLVFISSRSTKDLNLLFPLHPTVGWVDIGTVARVPMRFVVYFSKKVGK
jgi:hypothetical protein